jgi:NAD(P)-dependent dehydrogenase (short-subunit alcohol dehydrogenase family)
MKHSLVIGGTKATGKVIAKMFADKGFNVSVLGRTIPEDAKGGKISHESLDFTDDGVTTGTIHATLDTICKKNGPLNYVVFCQRFRGKEKDWENEFKASVDTTKKVIEYLVEKTGMMDEGDKSIVVLSSIASQLVIPQQPLSYHVAKASLETMMRYYAVTFASKKIRFNSVIPGTIVKPETREYYKNNVELRSVYEKTIPLGRMVSSEDISHLVEFLCDERSSMITGQSLIIDGGVSLIGQESLALIKAGK